MSDLALFPDCGIPEKDRLYIIGNGFDIHHGIKSQYSDFKEWIYKTRKDSYLVGLMDTFFSNDSEFWGDIEKALGEYDEVSITDFCEPDNPKDFKYDHPGQWQDGLEGSIPWVFGQTMDDFRNAFNEWVKSIDVNDIETDLYLPKEAKYLSFNYTETLEKAYYIPEENVLHIHGCRLLPNDEFVIGHGKHRDEEDPLLDEDILLPYQNAYSEVIRIMNEWRKKPEFFIKKNELFFQSINTCKAVCVMGFSYSDIDMPYLNEIASIVDSNCRWLLYYHQNEDKQKAEAFVSNKGLADYSIDFF